MKNSLATLAVMATASAASGQSWEFDISNPVLTSGSPTTTITASIDPGPGDFTVAAVNFSVHATETGWVDGTQVAIPATRMPPVPGQQPGTLNPAGDGFTGILIGQLGLGFGFTPEPGRIDAWRADFTATDFTVERQVDVTTETTRFDVYLGSDPFPDPWSRESRVPTEGRGSFTIIPAPASLALLGLGGLAVVAGRRRRPTRQAARLT